MVKQLAVAAATNHILHIPIRNRNHEIKDAVV